MESKFCSNCGKPLEEGQTICESCGIATGYVQFSQQEQQRFQQPIYNTLPSSHQQYGANDLKSTMSVGQYIGTMLIAYIPIAGLILYIVWAFSSDTNINKKNYCRASLLLRLILFGVIIVFWILVAVVASSANSYGRY